MKKKVFIPAALMTGVVAAGGFFYFLHVRPLEAMAAPVPPAPVPIVAATVAQHDVPIYLIGVGTVIAYNTDVVRAQIQGQIISINFTEGQTVHAGDLLAQIDPRPYQALIDQYTGQPGARSSPARECPGQSHTLLQIGGQGLGHTTIG